MNHDGKVMPVPKGTKEEAKKGTRKLTCPYCDGAPYLHIMTAESISYHNKHFDKVYKNVKHNYNKGLFCNKCKTTWLFEPLENGKNAVDTYVGKDVPRVREVITINGKTHLNFLPIKDWETGEYMPLLNPFSPLIKKSTS